MSGFIVSLFWFLLFVGGGIALAYNRIDLRTSTVATGIALLVYTIFGSGGFFWLLLLWLLFAVMVVPNLTEFRREARLGAVRSRIAVRQIGVVAQLLALDELLQALSVQQSGRLDELGEHLQRRKRAGRAAARRKR